MTAAIGPASPPSRLNAQTAPGSARVRVDHAAPGDRGVHVYVAPLVQAVRGADVEIWNPGPMLAECEEHAHAEAQDRLMRCKRPILILAHGAPPRFKVSRVVR